MSSLSSILDALRSGNTIAYPTEGVWGLGCDPKNNRAIKKLLELNGRSYEKGLIIIGSNFEQFEEYSFPGRYWDKLMSKWPGPHTWLVSSSTKTPKWLLGPTGLIALRLRNHKTVVKLTETLGMPICSTSANLSGNEPAKDSNEIRTFFKDKVLIIEGKLGDLKRPTPVQDLESEEWLRK